jgi:hypothetical protein
VASFAGEADPRNDKQKNKDNGKNWAGFCAFLPLTQRARQGWGTLVHDWARGAKAWVGASGQHELVHTGRMRSFRLGKRGVLVFLFAASVGAEAQQPANTGCVTGLVHLANTGKAAVGVTVSLLPPEMAGHPAIDPNGGEFIVKDQPRRGDFHATVDPLGVFEIKNVVPGDYFVLTYAPGYISQDDYIFPGALAPELRGSSGLLPAFVQRIHVAAGGVVPVDLRLERGGSIEGTIKLGDGLPAHTGAPASGEVAVSVEMKTKDGKFIRSGGAAHTDSAGHYRIEGLAPASYVVLRHYRGG